MTAAVARPQFTTRAVHWFRRDLRLDDHQALTRAMAESGGTVALFVLDRSILGRPDTGAARVHFMVRALAGLDSRLRELGSALVVREGDPLDVVPDFAAEAGASVVTAVRDAEPYARGRDAEVARRLASQGARLVLTDEQWLSAVPQAAAANVFATFHRRLLAGLPSIGRPAPPPARGFVARAQLPAGLPVPDPGTLAGPLAGSVPVAGEAAALGRLDDFAEHRLAKYGQERDRVDLAASSRLSADLRFGTLSVRRVYHAVAGRPGADKFISELAWRDFYAAVLWQRPEVETRAFRPAFDRLRWDDVGERLEAWMAGATGYPLVDAGMRQLREEHWLPNRVRMVVASFLCKDLHLDWRLGERHFMRELVDGDLASNNGGWQWSASTGTDPQPYFRIFNPTLQRARHDPSGEYCRRWLPELDTASYPAPIVDHAVERLRALRDYRAAVGAGEPE